MPYAWTRKAATIDTKPAAGSQRDDAPKLVRNARKPIR
jgi:hypothetical protein